MGCYYCALTEPLMIGWWERLMREFADHICEDICWLVRSWGLATSDWLWRRIIANSFRDVPSVRYTKISFTCRHQSYMHWLHHGHFQYGASTLLRRFRRNLPVDMSSFWSPLITSPSGWRLLRMRDWHHLELLVSSDHTSSVAMESLMSWFRIEGYISG